MEQHWLIVNRADGRLSTVATPEQIADNIFVTTPNLFTTYLCQLTAANLEWLVANWHDTYIIAPGLPMATLADVSDPERLWLQLTYNGGHYVAEVPTIPLDVQLTYARRVQLPQLEQQFENAKLGRFRCDTTNAWYDGKDFLLLSMAVAARGVDTPFACTSQPDGQWTTIVHTPADIAAAQASYGEWYQNLQVRFYQQQQACNNAHTVEAIRAIQF